MNILVITTLYPKNVFQTPREVSFAVHYLVKSWISQGNNVKVIAPTVVYPSAFNLFKKARNSKEIGYDERIIIDNVPVFRVTISKFPKLDFTSKSIQSVLSRISDDIIKPFLPDIIVCHLINPSFFIGLEIKKILHIPMVLVFHNSDIFFIQNRRRRHRYKEKMDLVSGIGFRSLKIQKEYNKIFNISTNTHHFIVHSGVSEDSIINGLELEIKLKNETTKIFVASTLIPLKNIDTIIKAFDALNLPNVYLEIAGEGPEESYLKNLASMSSAKNRIYFSGSLKRSEVIQRMKESHIFVLLSSPETLGLVYLEALASGCIVIGSKDEGIDGIIVDGYNGYLLKPKQVSPLTSLLNTIINLSQEDRREMMYRAVETAKMFTQDVVSREYIYNLKKTIETFKKGEDK